jgi:hypothetical protein
MVIRFLCVLIFIIGASQSLFCQAQLEEALMSLRKILTHEELPKIPLPHPEPRPPIDRIPTYRIPQFDPQSDISGTVVRDGKIIPTTTAINNDLVRKSNGKLRPTSLKTSIVDIDKPHLRRYREYFGLEINKSEINWTRDEKDLDIYDEDIISHVKNYQATKGLKVNGIISSKTRLLIDNDIYILELKKQGYLKSNYSPQDKKRSIIAFQAVNNLPISGKLDARTCGQLEKFCFPSESRYIDFNSRMEWLSKGDERPTFKFFQSDYENAMHSLGWGKKDQTNAEFAFSVVKFQEDNGLPITGNVDKETLESIVELKKIDLVIPSTYKKGKKLRTYKQAFIQDIQYENHLPVTGKLNKETRLVLRPLVDHNFINEIRKIPDLHNDFVNLPLTFNKGCDDVKFYFNDETYDYFILENTKLKDTKGLVGYRADRKSGEIIIQDIDNVLLQYQKTVNSLAASYSNKYTIIHLGLINKDDVLSITVGDIDVPVRYEDLSKFITQEVPIPEFDAAISEQAKKTILILRPDFALAKKAEGHLYYSIFGSDYSAVNTAKFAAVINKIYGPSRPVFLVSDVKTALKKLPLALKKDIDPDFKICLPDKEFFKEDWGWKFDDYRIPANLRARGVPQNQFYKIPEEIKTVGTNWQAVKGPKMFIGHKNDNFQTFLMYRVEEMDANPVFLVSCYLTTDEYFISEWIARKKMSNVIYFSEKIHPTVATDVIIEYDKLKKLPVNKSKPFYDLWRASIEATKLKFKNRYTDEMKGELGKLYKVISEITFCDPEQNPFQACLQNQKAA